MTVPTTSSESTCRDQPTGGSATTRPIGPAASAAYTGALTLLSGLAAGAVAPGAASWPAVFAVSSAAAAAGAIAAWTHLARDARRRRALDAFISELKTAAASFRESEAALAARLAESTAKAAASEEQLADISRERARLRAAVDQTMQAVVIMAPDGTIRHVNRAFERITGLAADAAIGAPIALLRIQTEEPTAFDTMLETLRGGRGWRGELRCRRADRTDYTCQTDVVPLRDESGAITDFVVTGEEISSRRTLEAQLRQAQKMEAVGRLAGGIAHDFNNLLMVILGHVDFLLTDSGIPREIRSSVETINEAAQRAARLTRQLLTFSRQKAVVTQSVDVNDLVRNMEPMVRTLVGEDITVHVATDAGGTPVIADASQLEQIVMNLVVNARDAMPRGGVLTIETANTRFRSEHAVRHGVLPAGDYVLLAVSDTGHGIEAGIQDRIFEPFYTTKDTGKGTGLGLSTVYGIVTQHGGQVEVYSEPGEGSTFKVYLPRIERAGAEPVAAPAAVEVLSGKETVLVVEDDDSVRELLRNALQRHGYTVIESRNGDEALLFSSRFAGSIDLLMTDMIMPRMSGVAVADAIRKQRPMTRTLFMSGYPEHSVLQHAQIDEAAFLRKPFSTESALNRIRQLLDT